MAAGNSFFDSPFAIASFHWHRVYVPHKSKGSRKKHSIILRLQREWRSWSCSSVPILTWEKSMRNCWSLWSESGTHEATRATLKMRLQLESQTFPPMSHERATYRLEGITLSSLTVILAYLSNVFRFSWHQGSNYQALHTNTTHCSTLILVGMLG